MRDHVAVAPAQIDARFVVRAARSVAWQRVGAVALVTLLLSLAPLADPALLDFFSPAELVLAWLGHLAELAAIATALLAAFAALDRTLPRALPFRLAYACAGLLTLSAALAVILHAYYAGGFEHLPSPLRMLSDSLRWGLPAVFLALVADVHQRALHADSATHAVELAQAQLRQGDSEQQLALLQAQIEPHFLFNVLANVRRLYRTRPEAGAEAIGSLMRYLRSALPQLRSRRACLGEEIALVRAYLELFQLRMGTQLRFSIDVDPALHDAEFPPMLLVTLAENAIKHGLEPMGGGHVEVRARRRRNALEVAVLDDGAGFAATASSGTGVGLVNVRRQLAARYGNQARFRLQAREPRGARASLVIPLRGAGSADKVAGDGVATATPATPATAAPPIDAPTTNRAAGLARWLQAHRGAAVLAGVLAFAGPLIFFTGALSVMREPSAANVARLGLWWTLYGASLWGALLIAGYSIERVTRSAGRYVRGAVWALAACTAAAVPTTLTAGRSTMLIEQGLVHSARTMHVHGFTVALIMALLYFAHLRRSRAHERAAARLAAAQAAQRLARRRIVEARLQEVQSRIDPRILFDLLDSVRRLYDRDAALAERYLDELIDFLRAALPRLRSSSSSLLREAELARAFVRLNGLAGAGALGMTIEVASTAMHARFPPGVLLPLLDGAAAPCRLAAERSGERCRVVLTLAAAPSEAAVARVRLLLAELYGAASELEVRPANAAVEVVVEVPYELA
jgi:sensor histidine kinase YesM